MLRCWTLTAERIGSKEGRESVACDAAAILDLTHTQTIKSYGRLRLAKQRLRTDKPYVTMELMRH